MYDDFSAVFALSLISISLVPGFPSVDSADLIATPKLINASQCTTTAVLDKGKYNILCATYRPNEENSFVLKAFSPNATLSALPQAWKQSKLSSEWKAGQNGGCVNNETTFKQNPTFCLKITQKTVVHIVLAQDAKNHVGFNLFRDSHLQDYIDSSNYINSSSVSKKFDLEAGEYFVLPTTFQPGIVAGFTLEIFSVLPHTLTQQR